MREVLVDSGIWIDFFRIVGSPAKLALQRLLDAQRALLVADLVLMEVLQGFRLLHEARRAEFLLAEFDGVTLGGEARARRAAANYRHLRTAGVTPRSSIDVLIATFCVDEGLELLTADRDFALMAPHLGLDLHQPATN